MPENADEEAPAAQSGETGDAGQGKSARPAFEELPPAAQRALKEAEERRKARSDDGSRPKEIGGRGGEDPTRYGDWEIDGRAVDF